MSRASRKGREFETAVARYLRHVLNDDYIEVRAKNGKNDRGDIAGVKLRGKRVVLECKNCNRDEFPKWIRQAEDECGNDDAEYGIAVFKRDGYGLTNKTMGQQYVLMTLETLAAIIAGGHDLLEGDDE